ncbi:hypothetical protein ID866_12343 [Astraeus odoratus]|nr:hypothetical protein ID866_12343 [Astraeus odoratus]
MEPARPQTPPPGKVVPPDTEPRSRHTSTVSYRTGDLSRGRTAVLKDLDSIPLVPLTYFNEAVLPPLRQGIDVQKIEETLQESGVIHNGCWAAFVNASGSANEEEYYGRLATIFDAVVQKTSEQIGMESKLSFVSKPSSPPISDRTNTSRPDAYLLLVDKKSIGSTADRSDSWYDVAVTFEFKKSGTERKLEDVSKVIHLRDV